MGNLLLTSGTSINLTSYSLAPSTTINYVMVGGGASGSNDSLASAAGGGGGEIRLGSMLLPSNNIIYYSIGQGGGSLIQDSTGNIGTNVGSISGGPTIIYTDSTRSTMLDQAYGGSNVDNGATSNTQYYTYMSYGCSGNSGQIAPYALSYMTPLSTLNHLCGGGGFDPYSGVWGGTPLSLYNEPTSVTRKCPVDTLEGNMTNLYLYPTSIRFNQYCGGGYGGGGSGGFTPSIPCYAGQQGCILLFWD